ncbi:hypothetical protein ASL14_13815 [Paenibacillus sp. IHB B 3084]|nr:hypothetical protein ASL14_13815 [Paenibacillus sp. IHB B 3084]
MILKLTIWILGFAVYFFFFITFLIFFVKNYPENSVTLAIVSSFNNVLINFGALIFSLILTVFIINFLIKLIQKDAMSIQVKEMSNFQISKLFFKVFIIIIFADITFSLLYFSFSTSNIQNFHNYTNILEYYAKIIPYYIQTFYYAFCLHFAVPMPTTPVIIELDKSAKELAHFQIVEFFHFCINKLIDITMLAYIAGIVIHALGFKKSSHN